MMKCIEWGGRRTKKGYGTYRVNGKDIRAHRTAWEAFNQACILPGYLVLHSCNNPPCVNPLHLRIGTALENAQQCKREGRLGQRGRAGSARLSDEQAAAIRERRGKGESAAKLAREFGVSASYVSKLFLGKRRVVI